MNKKLSKKVVWVVAPVMALTVLIGGRAVVSAADRQEAEKLAKTCVPADAVLRDRETDDGCYKFEYYSESTGTVYEIEIGQKSGTIREVETELRGGRGSQEATLTEDQVREIVQGLYPGAEISGIQLGKDDGAYSYDVYFRTADRHGSLELNAADGTVLESKIQYGTSTVISGGNTVETPSTAAETAAQTTAAPVETAASAESQNGNNGQASGSQNGNTSSQQWIGEDRAREIALSRAEGTNAEVYELKREREDGRMVYEGEMRDDSYKYEFELDASTGDVLKWEREARRSQSGNSGQASGSQSGTSGNQGGNTSSQQWIGEERAREIALGRAEGANPTVYELKREREDGRMVYEGEMRDDSYKYEFELDASTGDVLKWEREARRSQSGNSGQASGSQNGNGGQNGSTAAAISREEASSIALGKAQAEGAWLEELELDREDGKLVYEGEMRDNAYEYEFELDAATGEILKWEVEGLGR